MRETPRDIGGVQFFEHTAWTRWEWLVQGTTGSVGNPPPDFGLAGDQPVKAALGNWWRLLGSLPVASLALARQVHGTDLLQHTATRPGLHLTPPADGHMTDRPGAGLAVTVADCVPVFLLAPGRPAVALLHAGWRGTAGGILEAGIAGLARLAGDPSDLHVHLGPAICGECYEVGPEVHAALGLPAPDGPQPVDLRAVLAGRAMARGVTAAHVTVSTWCTRHDDAFFSHRRGDPARQIGLLGLRVP